MWNILLGKMECICQKCGTSYEVKLGWDERGGCMDPGPSPAMRLQRMKERTLCPACREKRS